ncbi:pentapeptide repeat-containing protein [Aeoliella sp. SH292]|uniref:pentapeptide repeat-containing protein n=1 Tax=Aeoliella sp. SH292 TaxID=3454464 RepID=UPI003F983B21
MNAHPCRSVAAHVALIILLAFGVFQFAVADTESPRVVLGPSAGDLIAGPGMNATGRNLQGSEFIGQDLTGAVFDGCNLYGVLFRECDLSHASFQGCILNGTYMDACEFDGAVFTNATINGANWSKGRFRGLLELSPEQLGSTQSYKTKDLQKCLISGLNGRVQFDFQDANLEHALFVNGDFSQCVFTNAEISSTSFSHCTITFKQIASTRSVKAGRLFAEIYSMIGKCDLSGLDLRGSDLPAEFSGQPVDLQDANINGSTLRGLTRAQLYSTASYKRGELTDIAFKSADLTDCAFAGVNLTGSTFEKCSLLHANFDDAVITGVNFEPYASAESEGLTVEQIRSTWNYKHGRMEGIVLPKYLAEAASLGTE